MAETNTPGDAASQAPTPNGDMPPDQSGQPAAQVIAPGTGEQPPVTGWAPVVSDVPAPADGAAPASDQPADTGDGQAYQEDMPPADVISWTASEFIAHQKTPGWYGLLILASLAGAGIVYLLTRDIISSSVVVVAGVFFGVFAARQPRELQYSLDGRGVQIGAKYYSLTGFRSFSVVPEGAFTSVILMPLKRFAPLTTIYFPPQDESRIVSILSGSLPFEDYRHDAVEQFLHRIRF